MNLIVTISDRGQITIPAQIRQQLQLSSGQKVLLSPTKDSLSLKPVAEDADIMSLFGSIKPRNKSTNPDIAIQATKTKKAQKTSKQAYE